VVRGIAAAGVVGIALVVVLGSGGFAPAARAAEPTPGPSSTTAAPAAPVAPPLDDPAGAGSRQCTPGSDEVVHAKPWHQDRMAAVRAWDLTRGKGVTVAVIDSGVQRDVPQLAGQVLPGFDVVNGRGTGDTDCSGHGTFVAGIIAARQVPGIGFTGVAPAVKILPIRQSNEANDGTAGGMAKAIRLAVDAGATVVNISSSSFFDSPELRAAAEYAARKDVLIVAAAANEAAEGNPKSFPASYPGVVAVGAVDENGKRTDFSETGDFIDLVAPGKDVISLAARGKGHLVGQGTSFATPFVAGTAALVRSYYPALTAPQVKRRLELTADHPGTRLPDPQLGFGVVNPLGAVSSVIPDEGDVAAPAAPQRVPLPGAVARKDTGSRTFALLFTAGSLGLAALAALVAALVPHGRRRGWRPAGTLP